MLIVLAGWRISIAPLMVQLWLRGHRYKSTDLFGSVLIAIKTRALSEIRTSSNIVQFTNANNY